MGSIKCVWTRFGLWILPYRANSLVRFPWIRIRLQHNVSHLQHAAGAGHLRATDPPVVAKLRRGERSVMAKLFWLEAVLPLGIIAGMLCVMGNAQYYIHKAAHGRPKHIGNDMWDVAMERRDKKIVEQYPAAGN